MTILANLLSTGCCPILVDLAGKRYRVDAVREGYVDAFDLACCVDGNFLATEVDQRLCDGRLYIEGA